MEKAGQGATRTGAAAVGEPERSLRLAEGYLADGRPRESIKVLEKMGDKQTLQSQVLLAQAYFDNFNNSSAEKVLTKISKSPELESNARAQLLLGELAFEKGDEAAAVKHVRLAHKLAPTSTRAIHLLRNLGEPVDISAQALAARAVGLPGADGDEVSLDGSTVDDDVVAFRTGQEQREPLGRALTHVAAGVVLLGALLGGYLWWADRNHQVRSWVVESVPLVEAGDLGSLREAQELLQQAETLKADDAYVVAGLAEVHALAWVEHGVAEDQDQAQHYSNLASADDIEKAERYSAQILAAVGAGQADRAVAVAKDVLAKGAVSEKIYYALARAQEALGRTKEARDNLRRAHELAGGSSYYATRLGDSYYADFDDRLAIYYWKLALQSNSSDVVAAARKLREDVRTGTPSKTVRMELERLGDLEGAKTSPRSQVALALAQSELLAREGKLQAALDSLNGAVTGASEEAGNEGTTAGAEPVPMLLEAKAQLQRQLGHDKAAVADMELAFTQSHQASRYLYGWVTLRTRTGDVDGALAALEERKEELGKSAEFLVALGDVYTAKKDFAAAAASYDAALKEAEAYPEALLGHGVAAWQKRDYNSARKWFEKAVSARSAFPEVYEAVGLMWIEQGATKDAHRQLEVAEKMFQKSGSSPSRMRQFYNDVITGFGKKRRGRSLAKTWRARQQSYEQGS